MTLALESDRRFVESYPVKEQQPDAMQSVALRLAGGRTAEVEFPPADTSVSAAFKVSGGEWEPHLRRYFESVVQPDWVCLDVGANLGVHTLSLAVLAVSGRVAAFESDAANFQLLSRNAAALAQPHAAIEPINLALWDKRGALVSVRADELAACAFVLENPCEAAAVERRLRAVANPTAISGVDLHIRLGSVMGMPLDAWVDENAPTRLDLIKLDVEGAEAHVIRGADATLRRYRPVLVVKYNPGCAESYFGQAPDILFRELEARFASIGVLELDGTVTTLPDWPALESRLINGKGWDDLVCQPGPCAHG